MNVRNLSTWWGAMLVAFLCLPQSLQAACECTAMQLRGGPPGPNTSSVYCTGDQNDIDGTCNNLGQGQQGCAADKFAYTCPLGPYSLHVNGAQQVGWYFEVAVTLAAGSVAAECEHGQITTRTATVGVNIFANFDSAPTPEAGDYDFQNGPEVEVVAEPTHYPQFGATVDGVLQFGADGYTENMTVAELNINVAPPQITWIDTPWFDWPNGQIGHVDFEFMNWADASDEESDNNCWCRFRINRTWDGQVAGGAGLVWVAGENCALANQ